MRSGSDVIVVLRERPVSHGEQRAQVERKDRGAGGWLRGWILVEGRKDG